MQGILTFASLQEAMRSGFTLYDRTAWGYVVRGVTPNGYALAIVKATRS